LLGLVELRFKNTTYFIWAGIVSARVVFTLVVYAGKKGSKHGWVHWYFLVIACFVVSEFVSFVSILRFGEATGSTP